MEQQNNTVQTATQSQVGTETPSTVETVAELSKEEIAELQEIKKNKVHFQSLKDKEVSEANKKLLEEQVRREMLERQIEELKNPKPVERQLVKPTKPVKPADYDPLDAVTRGTSSYTYEQAKADYIEQLTEYQELLTQKQSSTLEEKLRKIEELEEQKRKDFETIQFKNKAIADFQQEGLSVEEAKEAVELFGSPESLTIKNLSQMFKAIKNKNEKPTFTAPAAPGGAGGGDKPKTENYVKSTDTSWMYKTK